MDFFIRDNEADKQLEDWDREAEQGDQSIAEWKQEQASKQFIRIERPIRSKFWQALHNCIAHPMLTIYRPLGVKLHQYTADKMYEGEEYPAREDEVQG